MRYMMMPLRRDSVYAAVALLSYARLRRYIRHAIIAYAALSWH